MTNYKIDAAILSVTTTEFQAVMHFHIPIIAKSVCDFANNAKSDDYQPFAVYSSCEFAKFLYEKVLPMGEDDGAV